MDNQTNSDAIDFYFDPISPFAWLASTRLEEIRTQTGRDIIIRPILFAGLLKAHGNLGPAEVPAKRSYIFTDAMRRAASLGINIECPPQHPFNPLLALRTCTAVSDNETRMRLAPALCNATWRDGLDLTREETIRTVLTDCGLDADQIIAMTQDAEVKQTLIQETQGAVELGIFGVPTFHIDGEIFWGEDRIEALLNYLDGQRIDSAKLQKVLARPSAVQRRR